MSKFTETVAKFFGFGGTTAPKNLTATELHTLLYGDSGAVSVSETTAMQASAVYASVGLIGGAVASLPFHVYKRTKDGRERVDSDLWWLLNESPHPAWTSASAWHFTMQSILLKGDSFWMIMRQGPNVVGFKPFHPDNVTIDDKTKPGYRIYNFSDDGKIIPVYADDVLHFTGIGYNGTRSLTPVKAALGYAAGTTMSAEKYANAFFKGGARPDHAIEVPADVKLSPEQREMLKTTWGNQRSSYSEQGSTPVLTGGMKVVPLSMNLEDAQLLESRQYGTEEIARIFGIPPHMIGKTDASTSWGSGIEQMSIGFVRYTLRRHLDMVQQEMNRKLFPRSRMFYIEASTDALMEGDSKSQVEYFSKALGGPGTQGFMTINEVRKLKNLPAIAYGDEIVKSGAAQADPAQQQAMAALESRVQALAAQPKQDVPPTVVNNYVTLPEQQPSVVNIETPAINVAAPTINNILPEQQPTTVNVAAPNVTVEPTIVNLEATLTTPEVHNHIPPQAPPIVNATLPDEITIKAMPDRVTTSSLTRDANGHITRSTMTEQDA